jgi:phenylalanine-4-hydroxylase
VSVMIEPSLVLPVDHPGVNDPDYRKRRAEIAAVGERHQPGSPIPDVSYIAAEDELWALVSSELHGKQSRWACSEYLRSSSELGLPTHRVPQLREVDEAVRELTGFRIRPVPGLVPARDFYGALADRTFLSTQYVRHHSVPFYTPEPDIVHEIIGHAPMLASPVFAPLYEGAGAASLRATSDAAQDFFSRVFWFTLEFGVVREHGELKAYGAGLLSSYGEIESFSQVEIRPFDLPEMGMTSYDITRYQPVLYSLDSAEQLTDEPSSFFANYADDAFERLTKDRRSPR